MQRLFTALLLLVASSACDIVTLERPLGTPPSEDLSLDVDGVWQVGDGVLHVKYLGNGQLSVAWVGWEDGRFELKQTAGFLSTLDGVPYVGLFLEPESPEEEAGFLFGRYARIDEESAVLFVPRFRTFAEAVESGKLSGRGKMDQVHLDGDLGRIEDFVRAAPASDLFVLEEPQLLRRVTQGW